MPLDLLSSAVMNTKIQPFCFNGLSLSLSLRNINGDGNDHVMKLFIVDGEMINEIIMAERVHGGIINEILKNN